MSRPKRRTAAESFRHELRPLAELRARASELLQDASRTRRPVILTEGGAPAGVLLDTASYSELRETALLLEVFRMGRRSARGRRRPRRP
jgi:prevent-host-death family protein